MIDSFYWTTFWCYSLKALRDHLYWAWIVLAPAPFACKCEMFFIVASENFLKHPCIIPSSQVASDKVDLLVDWLGGANESWSFPEIASSPRKKFYNSPISFWRSHLCTKYPVFPSDRLVFRETFAISRVSCLVSVVRWKRMASKRLISSPLSKSEIEWSVLHLLFASTTADAQL